MLTKYIQNKINKGLLDKNDITTGFCIGMNQPELELSYKTDFIFASYQMASEGLDIPTSNTLLMIAPKKNIIQSIGRILRR
jgi:predicted helicase